MTQYHWEFSTLRSKRLCVEELCSSWPNMSNISNFQVIQVGEIGFKCKRSAILECIFVVLRILIFDFYGEALRLNFQKIIPKQPNFTVEF